MCQKKLFVHGSHLYLITWMAKKGVVICDKLLILYTLSILFILMEGIKWKLIHFVSHLKLVPGFRALLQDTRQTSEV